MGSGGYAPENLPKISVKNGVFSAFLQAEMVSVSSVVASGRR